MRFIVQTPSEFDPAPWAEGLSSAFPGASVRVWREGDEAPADYALVWRSPESFWQAERGLTAAFSLTAGVDALVRTIPRHIPLVRLDDAGMAASMSAYVAHAALRVRLGFDTRLVGGDWSAERAHFDAARERPCVVGVLGLGVLGGAVAATLHGLGFETHGWSRAAKSVPGVVSHSGVAGLHDMLSRTNLLVNLLPLTPQTEGMINTALLARLPVGAHVINVGRGAHVVDADLLAALDTGKLSGATLDVFRTEPLPSDHAYRRHPKVFMTPHVSARTEPGPALAQIVAKIRRLERGERVESLPGFVDYARGY